MKIFVKEEKTHVEISEEIKNFANFQKKEYDLMYKLMIIFATHSSWKQKLGICHLGFDNDQKKIFIIFPIVIEPALASKSVEVFIGWLERKMPDLFLLNEAMKTL